MFTTIAIIGGVVVLIMGATQRKRLVRVLRAHAGWLISRAENPELVIDQALAEMDGAYRQAREATARVVADQKHTGQQMAAERAEVERWANRAQLAVDKGKDDLAREALVRKREHAKAALEIEQQLIGLDAHAQELRNGLVQLEQKIGEAKRRKNLLVAKQRRAEAQNSIYATLGGIQNEGGLEVIDRMETKIDEMCAVADARVDLKSESERLENRFHALESADVDQELLELKNARCAIEYKPVEQDPLVMAQSDAREKVPALAAEGT